MLITREITEHGNILPSIVNVVRDLPPTVLSHEAHTALPPETIAFRAVHNVVKNFRNTVTTLADVESYLRASNGKEIQQYRLEALADDYVALLASITAFIEDCHHIFKVTMPYRQINVKFVSKWLQAAGHPTASSFFQEIKNYRDEIAVLTNAQKHEHGRIDVLVGFKDNDLALGYVVKDLVNADGELKHRLDLNKVLTFYSALRYHFYQFYRISEVFTRHFLDSLKQIHGYDHVVQKAEIELSGFNSLIPLINQSEFVVFPNAELFSSKTFLELSEGRLRLYNPIGLIEENVEYTIRQTMEDGTTHLYVPDDETLAEMKDIERLNAGLAPFQPPSDFNAKYHVVLSGLHDKHAAKEVKYNGVPLRIRTWGDMSTVHSFIGGMDLNKTLLIASKLEYPGLLEETVLPDANVE